MQAGRVKHHDYPFSPTSPPGSFTIEFFPDCVESEAFLQGIYGVQCNIYQDGSGLLHLVGHYYPFGSPDSERGIYYARENQ